MTPGPGAEPAELTVGDEVEIEIGPVAHGGHCVARYEGRVLFVRHALPGERVIARITEAKAGSFGRADAVSVLTPAADRVEAPCRHFHPGGCGGCDFQHASPELQRTLKSTVVEEQLRRLGGVERRVEMEQLPGTGFGWRSRVRWGVQGNGSDRRVGPRFHRSRDVVPLSVDAPCLIAAAGLTELGLSVAVDGPEVALTFAGDGTLHAGPPGAAAGVVLETVFGRDFEVAADGFWQVHPEAAEALVDAVLEFVEPELTAGGTAWDLYGGVGLFAAFLAQLVGPDGSVVSVELDRTATALAHRNLVDQPQVAIVPGRVERVVPSLPGTVDAVVLDPPRTGAGRAVCQALADREPAVIVYVACDPAALGRDTRTLGDLGYRLDGLRAFDAFPQTHHIECVARFVR